MASAGITCAAVRHPIWDELSRVVAAEADRVVLGEPGTSVQHTFAASLQRFVDGACRDPDEK